MHANPQGIPQVWKHVANVFHNSWGCMLLVLLVPLVLVQLGIKQHHPLCFSHYPNIGYNY